MSTSAHDLGYERACELVEALDPILDITRTRARGISHACDAESEVAYGRALDLTQRLRPGAFAYDLNFDQACARALNLDFRRACARTRRHARGRDAVLINALDQAVSKAGALDLTLTAELGLTVAGESTGKGTSSLVRQQRIAPTAVRLSKVAALLLPPAARGRYAEEFWSELWELAAAGAGRHGQLAYAARLLARARAMQLALRTLPQQRAGQ